MLHNGLEKARNEKIMGQLDKEDFQASGFLNQTKILLFL